MSSCLTSGSDGKGFKPLRVQRYKKYLEYANFLIKNERAGDGIALKLPRIKRRKEQHKARARMREKCTERTAKKEQAKTEIRVFCGRRRGRGRCGA